MARSPVGSGTAPKTRGKILSIKELKRELTKQESKRVTGIENIGPTSRLQMGKLGDKNVVRNANTDGKWHFQPKISELVAARKTG